MSFFICIALVEYGCSQQPPVQFCAHLIHITHCCCNIFLKFMSDILFFENYSSTNWRPRTLTLSHVILGKLVKCSLCFSLKVKLKVLSRVQLFATLWTIAHQASLSMGFPRQEYWTGLPFPSPGDLPNPGNDQFTQLQKQE